MKRGDQIFRIGFYLVLALVLRFFILAHITSDSALWQLQIVGIILVFGVGIGYVFRGTAKVIEETTDVLKDRTRLAGGFLQAFGTAFPDMVIGVTAAFVSLQVRDTDYIRAINLAIVAASTTFGSNIYNILHAAWCTYRQNLANIKHKTVLMFPPFRAGGKLKPFEQHEVMPSINEMDSAIKILTALTILTAFVAISMVLFGQVKVDEVGIKPDAIGDIYQLILPVGIILFVLCAGTLYYFGQSQRPESPEEEIIEEEKYYSKQSSSRIWLDLVLSGIAILFTAESMVKTIEIFSHLTHVPFVVTGILAGVIGCFGEMTVIHNFSIHPKGRIGDAIVGVAMDNIVTTLGAAIVAIMGGIFLGSNSLILIFVLILALNTILIQQISQLKNSLKLTIHRP